MHFTITISKWTHPTLHTAPPSFQKGKSFLCQNTSLVATPDGISCLGGARQATWYALQLLTARKRAKQPNSPAGAPIVIPNTTPNLSRHWYYKTINGGTQQSFLLPDSLMADHKIPSQVIGAFLYATHRESLLSALILIFRLMIAVGILFPVIYSTNVNTNR